MVEKFNSKDMEIDQRLDFIEFRQELIFSNTEVDRLLFEYNITEEQYIEIMNLMDSVREAIESEHNGSEIDNERFEQKIYNIVEHLNNNYHFCEYLTRAFKNEGRWEEVFDELYGHLPKYKGLS